MLDQNTIETCRFGDLYRLVSERRGQPGSAADDLEWRLLSIRIVQELCDTSKDASGKMCEATGQLAAVVSAAANASEATQSQLVRLNRRLCWLNVLMVFLTAVILAVAVVQLRAMTL